MGHDSHAMRQSSLDAYFDAADAGLLTEQQRLVLAALGSGLALTAREIDAKVGIGDIPLGRSLQPTVHHLVKADAVEEVGKRACTVTGREVLVYQATGRPPRKVHTVKGLSPEEKLAALAALRSAWKHIPAPSRAPLARLGAWLAKEEK